ncbi:MAG: RNA 2',3'-cyclic phosphodiesterase, partial [Thermoplasmata archaeon]|nr:RNA 2',3'-cyclic phosphodiesterase [Thermoplasmata archaeon]
MRLCFSVRIPYDEIFSDIQELLEGPEYHGIRAVDPSLHHITLKFLGDTGLNATDLSNPAGEAAGSTSTFDLEIGGAGAFPTWKRPSVIWMGFHDQAGLQRLASNLERKLSEALGVEIEKRAFHGHITLARVRKGASLDAVAIGEMVEEKAGKLKEKGYSIGVESFDLMRSTLTAEGPLYEVIGSYPLS